MTFFNGYTYFGTTKGTIGAMDFESSCDVVVQINSENNPIKCIAGNNKSKFLVTGDLNGQIMIWKDDALYCNPVQQHEKEILCLEFLDEQHFASCALDQKVIVWSIESKKALHELYIINFKLKRTLESLEQISWVSQFIKNIDDKYVLIGGDYGIITILDWSLNEQITDIKGHLGTVK